MTRTISARIAGAAFLLYLAAGIVAMAGLSPSAVVKLLLSIAQWVCAVVLAVTLYIVTRDEGPRVAALGLICRVGEGVVAATLRNTLLAATFFAVGSTLFCWLLLRGRTIPVGLAWLGLCASVLLLPILPLQLAGLVRGPITMIVWLPMAAFEIPAGVWLILKGTRVPAPARA